MISTPPKAAHGVANMLVAAALAAVGALPVFLLGALAVLIRTDLGFTEARLGATAALYFAVASTGSIPAGRVADWLGAQRALLGGVAMTSVALLAVSQAQSWAQLTLALAVGGAGHSVIQVGANRLLSSRISPDRQGFAFGVKQSAIPIAAMLAGLAVPLLGVSLGWRGVYLVAMVLAFLVAVLHHTRGRRVGVGRPPRSRGVISTARPSLLLMAIGGGFGSAAANGSATFMVEYAVQSGVAVGTAGLLYASGSLAGILVRVSIGWLADRRPVGDLRVVAAMLLVGAVTLVAMPAAGSRAVTLALGIVMFFAAGWGWPGLFTYIVVRDNPNAPGAASGFVHVGIFGGAVLGPLLFGLAVSNVSYTLAWTGVGVSSMLAAVMLLIARRIGRGTPPNAPHDNSA